MASKSAVFEAERVVRYARSSRRYTRTLTCQVCGKSFESTRYDATTCSSTCRSTKRRRELAAQKYRRDAFAAVDALIAAIKASGLAEDIAALEMVERSARTALLALSEQQRYPLAE